MALVACPECSIKVSDGAFKCPSCGFTLKKPKRGFFGKMFKWSFILFNALMLWWMIGGMSAASEHTTGLSGAEQAGAAVGMGIGFTFILGIWVVGDIILGMFVLFTRPKTA